MQAGGVWIHSSRGGLRANCWVWAQPTFPQWR